MSLLGRIFGQKEPNLICPHCEKELVGHDDAACQRRMSRRFFFGAMLGGVVAAAVGPALVEQFVIPAAYPLETDYSQRRR